eukprot:882978-Rhodomonas_salina.2
MSRTGAAARGVSGAEGELRKQRARVPALLCSYASPALLLCLPYEMSAIGIRRCAVAYLD